MARGGIYKTEVKRARDSLVAMGKNPSIEAVRAALGSGSNSTIHKYLKELAAEDAQSTGERVGLSDALTDLVARLAGQLQHEADAIVADAEGRYRSELAQNEVTLATLRDESTRRATAIEETLATLRAERETHEVTRRELAEARLTLAAQGARLDGLVAQLAERDQHLASLEQKHHQARDALEHFRTAAKEQRDQELRRHDHALLTVQLELRQTIDSLTAKNHELQQLHRDNGRLLANNATSERELSTARSELRLAADRVAKLQGEVDTLHDAERQHALVVQQRDQLSEQLERVRASLQVEIEARRIVDTERDRLIGRIQATEEVVERLGRRPRRHPTVEPSADRPEPPQSTP